MLEVRIDKTFLLWEIKSDTFVLFTGKKNPLPTETSFLQSNALFLILFKLKVNISELKWSWWL